MDKFYLGLDIGTESVGIACTDESYNILRAKGKDCWAVRLFDPSNTAQERRGYRSSRRRLARRKERIGFLQGLFAPYMDDNLFFIRLNNSQYYVEDKDESLKESTNNLFDDKDYDDKDFHKKYPTIYHLRKALMTERITDLRLYYLALHHIIKYRGHFLFEGSMEDIRDISKLVTTLNSVCSDLFEEDVPYFDIEKTNNLKEILLDSQRDKAKRLAKLFDTTNKRTLEILKGICGDAFKPVILFGDEKSEEKSIKFKELNDEMFEALRPIYNDEFILLESMRSVYNYITFEKLLVENDDISSSMIGLYEKHKKDLIILKDFIHNNSNQDEYNRMFKKLDENANYANYIGYSKKGGNKKKVKVVTDDDFFAYVKKFVENIQTNDITKNYILDELERGTFLPKILHSDQGLFPHQVNEYELDKIISNMVKNIPLTLNFADKIKAIFLYKIPYYIGPLTKGYDHWVVKKSDEKITPWNFNDVIDITESGNNFIKKMINKCTYLHGEDVLPKYSIYYQKYNVLNQINKLKYNEIAFDIDTKKGIYNDLFLKRKKVTIKQIINWLVEHGKISESEKKDIVITGVDGEINANMSSYIQLKDILGDFVDDDLFNNGGVCENIILWNTLHTEKKNVEELIRRNYSNIPTIIDNIKRLKGMTCKDFGRMSLKFLKDIRSEDKTTGEFVSILDILYDTNMNLNEIINCDRYDFQSLIKQENNFESSEITDDDIRNLYVSPAVHRGIYQSLKMIDEYVSVLGKEPDKIFIEVTREDGKKGQSGKKESRKNSLLKLYKDISDGNVDFIKAQLDNETDIKLRQERLYLYYRQLGRCMYSGEEIDLERLNTNMYDVDHILPRTYIKDDSLDNKVLVLRSKNASKSDIYPIPGNLVSENAKYHWDVLRNHNLISETTYNRLKRTEPLSENDYNDFINRQKVITDQTVLVVAKLLERKYQNTKIVYSKAKNVSEFKQKFDLFKCRETNNLHHARDAYLNIVVGNVFDICFSTPMALFYKDGDAWRNYNLKTMFLRNVDGAWPMKDKNDISTLLQVKNSYFKHTMCVTRYSYCNKGAFYNQTIYSGDNGASVPRKGNGALNDVGKYGGYNSLSTAYFAIVSSEDKKGNPIKTIEAIPVLVDYKSRINKNAVGEYLDSYLKNAQIVIPKVKIKQLIEYNGTLCYLSGVTGNRITIHNGVELFTDNKTDEYINALLKLQEMSLKGELNNSDEYIIKTNKDGEVKLVVDRNQNEKIYQMLIQRLNKQSYQGVSSILSFKDNIEKGFIKFKEISVLDQSTILIEIVKFFKCDATMADLTKIEGSKYSGKLMINKNITNEQVLLINQSSCGLSIKKRMV